MSSEMVKDPAIAIAEHCRAQLKKERAIGQLKCYECGVVFNNQLSLSRHAQIHLTEFRCGKDGCEKAFSSHKLLCKHLRRHSDTKLVVRIVPFNIRAKIEIKEEQEERKLSRNEIDTAKDDLQMDHSGSFITLPSTSYTKSFNSHSHKSQVMSRLISAERVETKLWLCGEMKRLADLTIDSLSFRLIMLSSSAASVVPQHSSTVSELCQLMEGQKEETNRLVRVDLDRVVNWLFLKLTSKLLMNMDWDRSGDVGDHSQLGNSSNQFESSKPQPSTSTSSFYPHQTDVFKLIAAESENSKLWFSGEMVRLADPMIASLFLRLIISTATVTPGHSSTVSELCHLIEGQKEETNRLVRVDLDRVVNSLFLRLTNKLLVNMVRAKSGDVVHDESVHELGHPAVDNGNRPETDSEGGDGGNVETIEDIEPPSCKRRRVSTAQPNNLQLRLAIQNSIGNEPENGPKILAEVTQEIEDESEMSLQDMPNNSQNQQNKNAAAVEVGDEREASHVVVDNDGDEEDTQFVQNPIESNQAQTSGQSQATKRQSERIAYRNKFHNEQQKPNEVTSRDNQDEDEIEGDDDEYVLTSGEEEENDEEEEEEEDYGEGSSTRQVKRPRLTTPTTSSGPKDKQIITITLQCTLGCKDKINGLAAMFAENDFDEHMKTEHSLSKYRCVVKDCTASFHKRHSIKQHNKQSHQNTTQWNCNSCSKHFSTYRHLSTHNIDFHQLGNFQCSYPTCTFKGENKNKVYTHYRTHNLHMLTLLTCSHPGCPYETPYHDVLKIHSCTHSGNKPFRCKWPNCDYTSTNRPNTIRHIRSMHVSELQDPKEYFEVVN